MGKITDITPQKHDKSRVNLYVDGEFLCGLQKLTALEHRLHTGDEIDEETLRAAIEDSERTVCFERAAGYLARPRTGKEMRTYLLGKGYGGDTVAHTLHKLCDYGYIDDAAYARTYAREYGRKFGKRKIESDLLGKGIDRDVIEEVLEDFDEDASAAAEKYLRTHAPDKRKLTAYLLSKGFGYDAVKDALSDIDFAGGDEDDDTDF